MLLVCTLFFHRFNRLSRRVYAYSTSRMFILRFVIVSSKMHFGVITSQSPIPITYPHHPAVNCKRCRHGDFHYYTSRRYFDFMFERLRYYMLHDGIGECCITTWFFSTAFCGSFFIIDYFIFRLNGFLGCGV